MTQKITFIGAGSTIFMKNILGDILYYPALKDAEIALMDIDVTRLSESVLVAQKLVKSLNANAKILHFSNQKEALQGADFVVVCFQIGLSALYGNNFQYLSHLGLSKQLVIRRCWWYWRGLRVPHYGQFVKIAFSLPASSHAAVCQPDGNKYLGDKRAINH